MFHDSAGPNANAQQKRECTFELLSEWQKKTVDNRYYICAIDIIITILFNASIYAFIHDINGTISVFL